MVENGVQGCSELRRHVTADKTCHCWNKKIIKKLGNFLKLFNSIKVNNFNNISSFLINVRLTKYTNTICKRQAINIAQYLLKNPLINFKKVRFIRISPGP